MPNNSAPHNTFRVIVSPRTDKIFASLAKRDPVLHERIEEQISKMARNPYLGKPLRYGFKNQRRLHVGSFVITYEIRSEEICILDFDHHDKIYKKG